MEILRLRRLLSVWRGEGGDMEERLGSAFLVCEVVVAVAVMSMMMMQHVMICFAWDWDAG